MAVARYRMICLVPVNTALGFKKLAVSQDVPVHIYTHSSKSTVLVTEE